MALIEDNVLSFMFEGVRRGDEDKLKAKINKDGEVTLRLLRQESPNLFRSIFHFEIVEKFVPQEATPMEPPPDWAVHGDIPELITETPKQLDITAYFNNEIPELKEEIPLEVVAVAEIEVEVPVHYNGYNHRVEEDVADDTSDLLVVEGDELVGETQSVKFPDKEEEIIVDKPEDAPKVKVTKAKKAK